MVPNNSALKHASTSVQLCQIVSGFAKDTHQFKKLQKQEIFPPAFLHNRLPVYT